MIERHHLAILLEVDRRGSLTAAADALSLTQSALSHSIRKLEGLVGTELWRKDGRGLAFTQAGAYLLSVAQRLLPQLEHADAVVQQIAAGQRGTLRIGVECHPCHHWLLGVVAPFLEQWPDVDLDVKQKFRFGGIGALYGREIDLLITPDPLAKDELVFEPVMAYEQVLAVAGSHPLAERPHVVPRDLAELTLITYPVDVGRLDVYTDFLLPANCRPKRRKVIESADVLLQMVLAGRGVAALPAWLVSEYAERFPVIGVRLGEGGVHKQLFVGLREEDAGVDHVAGFLRLARSTLPRNNVSTH